MSADHRGATDKMEQRHPQPPERCSLCYRFAYTGHGTWCADCAKDKEAEFFEKLAKFCGK